ncbi:MAG: ATP-dependent Clp protease ATP-binding subunit [Christensenellaceae bacterium]|nr:ATP-dependent Clp protease ATP-binding subunit [Christensenellaceae bacterium]
MSFDRYNKQAENALRLAKDAAEELKHGFIGSEHVLLGLIRGEGSAADALVQFGVTEDVVLPYIDTLVGGGRHRFTDSLGYTPSAKRILELALYEAKSFSENLIDTKHILLAILRESDCFASKILEMADADTVSMKQYLYGRLDLPSSMQSARPVQPEQSLQSIQFVNELKQSDQKRSGVHSATPIIDTYTSDLTALARSGKLDPLIGCENELNRLIQTLLRRGKNNPVLIGNPGVGKSAIVEGFAARISCGKVPEELKTARVVRLDLGAMLAGTKFRGEFEERLKAVLDESTEDIILFIDEIHTIIGAGAGEGSIDAANIMKPALARRGLRVIGATTLDEYRRYIEKDAALERRFSPIIVNEPSRDEAIAILQGLKSRYEAHHNVFIGDDAVNACVEMSIRCLPDRFLPDKAIDLMDEAASKARLGAGKGNAGELDRLRTEIEDAVNSSDFERAAELRIKEREMQFSFENAKITVDVNSVASVVHDLTGIPMDSLVKSHSERLSGLETELKKRIFGQDLAINDIARAVRKGYAGISSGNGPLCSILIAGSSGVGKTELAHALSEELFPGEDALIRFDMAEYFNSSSVNRLIGTPAGYKDSDEGGRLTEAVRRKPYAVVLFDDFQHAHFDVCSLLGRIICDGSLTDARGRSISFRNAIVIFTVGMDEAESHRRAGFSSREGERSSVDRLDATLKKMIPAEIVSSVDCIAELGALDREAYDSICRGLLKELEKHLKSNGVHVRFDETIVRGVCDSVAHKESTTEGARPLRRHIAAAIEDRIGEKLLTGEIVKGIAYRCLFTDGKLLFKEDALNGT